MSLGPFYYDSYVWGAPQSFQNIAITSPAPEKPKDWGKPITFQDMELPSGEITTSSEQTSSLPRKSRYDEFLESMGGKKIENPCGEMPLWDNPSIRMDELKSRRWDLIKRAQDNAKSEIQDEEDRHTFKMMDDLANHSIDEIEKANEIMNQKTKASELIIQNPDYMTVKRNENVQELYSRTWNTDYLELPKEKYYMGGSGVNELVEFPGGNLTLGEPDIIKPGQEYVLTFDSNTANWTPVKNENKPNLFDSKGEVNATSIKDALQELSKYAKIFEKETKPAETPGGAAMQHPIESNVFIEPSYVTHSADSKAKVKHIIDAAIAEEKRDELITTALNSEEGKKALAMSMAEPIRRNLNYASIARAAFPIEQIDFASEPIVYAEASPRGYVSAINEMQQVINNIEQAIELKDKKKQRRRRKMAPVNPLFLFTLAAAGAGMAHATKQESFNENIKVRQINE